MHDIERLFSLEFHFIYDLNFENNEEKNCRRCQPPHDEFMEKKNFKRKSVEELVWNLIEIDSGVLSINPQSRYTQKNTDR